MASHNANGSYPLAPSNGFGDSATPASASTNRADWIEQRRQQRAASTVTVWAASPPAPANLELEPASKSTSRKRRTSLSSSSSDDSEAERKRRKHRKHRSSRREERKSSSRRRDEPQEEEEMWVEREAPAPLQLVRAPPRPADDSDDDVGPQPAPEFVEKAANAKDYGDKLLRGEGTKMAAFVTDGKRIPRRGEIGIEADDIDAYEKAGFVMSGSRNKKMETVRTRKENQVITAEEKRSLLKLQKEEKFKRETDIIASFKEMVDKSLNPPAKPRPA